ncbi:LysR substrate-binding domain-containing protein [Algibacillus agarilyticus]|uniref:LysR substrate-binding domain-containing protein n=1 Tax=Algibacillus agarilyticus TaxID=2234133 RepID=UPI0018E57154|nr:LysR substrate-binding domain-containing protein [Algibacillus agarilyticus]
MKTPAISIEALMVLDAIQQRGSYAAAAEQLNKVTSALSYIVQKTEEQLGVTLFQREGRRAVLTPAGKHVVDEGRIILSVLNKLSEQTQTIANGWEPKIRVAIDSIVEKAPVFELLNEFLIDHPSIEFDVSEEVLNGTWEALIEDRVDLLIGAPEPIPVNKGIHTAFFCQFDVAFVVAPNHALAKIDKPVAKDDISQYRTVITHDSVKTAVPWTSDVIDQSLRFYVATVEDKINAIKAGIGGGFLPKTRIADLLKQGRLVEVPLTDVIQPKRLHVAWKIVNKGKGLQRLKAMLKARFNEQEQPG